MNATRLIPLTLSLGLLLAAGQAAADEATAKTNGCLACHAVDKKMVGPSFKSIASKHKGEANAADKLAASVRAGGKGTWGQVPMPPQAKISDADLKKVLAWILAQ
ncbi:MAG: cytochrome c class I [bacterium]|nr:MAG: cytochrome c class I [bacterium]KAF0149591.1 MAG: cytochrome c class I [bacterium]KAF0169257.1 MAG: cytochrome c class I [bacterium]TXT18507.1 MAG: cytochrome c class I [bacterium]